MTNPELSPKVLSEILEIVENDISTEYNNVDPLDVIMVEGEEVQVTVTPNGQNYMDYSVGSID
ncbi:MAG TPA: hypothetical protein PLD54_04585 [Candidatus Levybacteria bacterium]|nr:hypothetical protein [Candidatus Levybacteria bacterium]